MTRRTGPGWQLQVCVFIPMAPCKDNEHKPVKHGLFIILACLCGLSTPVLGAEPDASSMAGKGHVGNCASCHGERGKNQYAFEPALTRIVFSVGNLGAANLTAVVSDVGGGFILDVDDPESASVVATMDTRKVDMLDDLLNAIVRSERFLDAARYPTIRFASTKIKKTGAHDGIVVGDLTLRGVTEQISLTGRFNMATPKAGAKPEFVGFSGTTTILRSALGLTLGLPAIGDEISVRVEAVGRLLE